VEIELGLDKSVNKLRKNVKFQS